MTFYSGTKETLFFCSCVYSFICDRRRDTRITVTPIVISYRISRACIFCDSDRRYSLWKRPGRHRRVFISPRRWDKSLIEIVRKDVFIFRYRSPVTSTDSSTNIVPGNTYNLETFGLRNAVRVYKSTGAIELHSLLPAS